MELPIDPLLPQVVAALRDAPCVVLQAPTGAGKTTRVPLALHEAGFSKEGLILMLEPRRLAARAAARQLARQTDQELGQRVGYHVRFDRKACSHTQILVVTEGIFLRMLQDDPFLESIAVVVFDEFHERSLSSDVALAMTRKVQQEIRPELRLVAMSATLETEELVEYLGPETPLLTSEGRSFPIDIQHVDATGSLAFASGREWISRCAAGIRDATRSADGDVLVFLPGIGEIRGCLAALEGWAESQDLALMPLYGGLSLAEQDRVLAPASQRKIILSTNVAETSLTIEGIGVVVDSGWARVMRHDASRGVNRLERTRSSKASAAQRAGRAGRTGPGSCLRLWAAVEHPQLPERESPEICQVELSSTVLELLAWGETDLAGFPWLTPPPPESLEQAYGLLTLLGAVDRQGALTERGRQMAALPLHPRLSRLLLAAQGARDDAALLAALLSERDPFPRSRRDDASYLRSPRDVLERLQILRASKGSQTSPLRLKKQAVKVLFQAQRQLLSLCKALAKQPDAFQGDAEELLGRALLAAFPDRLCKRRDGELHRALMADGQGLRGLEDDGPLPGLFVCLEFQAGDRKSGRSEAIIRQFAVIEEAWIDDQIEAQIEVEFDPGRERVVAFLRRRCGSLVLSESIGATPPPEEAQALLAEAAAERLDEALGLSRPALASWLTRARCLASWRPELELPAFDQEHLQQMLPLLCMGKRSFGELQKAPVLDILKGSLSYSQLQAIEREAPERFEVPSGSRIRLRYEVGQPPILAARIQELFGLRETPSIAAGRVPLLLHLLAPNMRPQQITQDLQSFWDQTYPEVRKELRQRYPKHAWPEDPWNAVAQRRPQRRKRGS